jgi:4-amino-4-deoxy-L-arabinose transferase-like glycosyltransferase
MINQRSSKKYFIMAVILLIAAYLRIYQLETIPNGLIPDEVMRGYDAYALYRTGADSFGEKFFPLFLRGFDDYTPALYSYLTIPFIAIFDLSARSTRLAAAVIGVLTVALAYPLIRRPFGETAALAGAFLLAISPWHILASRTGTEWNLLAFGPLLTVCLAYRGLKRPAWLIAAGIAAGLSLYGYAPVKAFLPVLAGGFILFYRSELRKFKKFSLIGLLAFIAIAAPIYLFSFTPEGAARFNIVFDAKQQTLAEAFITLTQNYLSYFSPRFFILSQYENPQLPVHVVHLKSAGLLSWFELFLILLGLIKIFLCKDKNAWFIFYWLVVSPLGINLHDNSPWPTLWLTAIPIPHTLAGAGFAALVVLARGIPFKTSLWSRSSLAASAAALSLLVVTIGILHTAQKIHQDLFYEYPIYGAKDGRQEAILMLESLKNQYDQVTIPSTNLSTSIYLLFYNRYDPALRHAELAASQQEPWQKIDHYNLGEIEDYLHLPGCHLVLTSIAHGELIKTQLPQLIPIKQFYLPNGEPNVGLYALPSPLPARVESGAVFDDKLMLQGFALVSTSPSTLELQPGHSLCLILQWQALTAIGTDYTVFVHLVGPHNAAGTPTLWTQHDGPPLHGLKPTSTWSTGEAIQDIHRLALPEMPPGNYTLEVGLYNPLTGERMTLSTGEDKLVLMELNIQANPVTN